MGVSCSIDVLRIHRDFDSGVHSRLVPSTEACSPSTSLVKAETVSSPHPFAGVFMYDAVTCFKPRLWRGIQELVSQVHHRAWFWAKTTTRNLVDLEHWLQLSLKCLYSSGLDSGHFSKQVSVNRLPDSQRIWDQTSLLNTARDARSRPLAFFCASYRE